MYSPFGDPLHDPGELRQPERQPELTSAIGSHSYYISNCPYSIYIRYNTFNLVMSYQMSCFLLSRINIEHTQTLMARVKVKIPAPFVVSWILQTSGDQNRRAGF